MYVHMYVQQHTHPLPALSSQFLQFVAIWIVYQLVLHPQMDCSFCCHRLLHWLRLCRRPWSVVARRVLDAPVLALLGLLGVCGGSHHLHLCCGHGAVGQADTKTR